MEIRQLQYFLAVARELNFTRAARTLHITVPPLTRQIQALEHELGRPLFDRSTHHVALTEAGEKLVVLASGVVADVEAIPSRLRPDGASDAVRVSVPFSLSSRVRNALSRALSQHSSDYVFAISQVASGEAAAAVRDNRVDFALTHVVPDPRLAESAEIDHEELGLLLDARHFPDSRESVSLADLDGFSYIHGPRSWEIEEMTRAQQDLFAAGVVNHAEERYDDLAAMLIALSGARKLTWRSLESEELRGLDASTYRVIPVDDVATRFTTHLAWQRGPSSLSTLRAELLEDLHPVS